MNPNNENANSTADDNLDEFEQKFYGNSTLTDGDKAGGAEDKATPGEPEVSGTVDGLDDNIEMSGDAAGAKAEEPKPEDEKKPAAKTDKAAVDGDDKDKTAKKDAKDAEGKDADKKGEADDENVDPRTPQGRINQAIGRQREAERRAEAAEKKAAEIEARLAALEKGEEKPKAEEGKTDQAAADAGDEEIVLSPELQKQLGEEPDSADFEMGEEDRDYIRAIARYEAKREFLVNHQKEDNARQQEAFDEAVQEAETKWNNKVEAVAEKYPDFKEKVLDNAEDNWKCTIFMSAAIHQSDVGADIAYHLATHPDEAADIAQMDPVQQVQAITRLETGFAQEAAPASKEEPQKKPVKVATDAPEPAGNRARGAGGRYEVPDDTDDLEAFERKFYQQG